LVDLAGRHLGLVDRYAPVALVATAQKAVMMFIEALRRHQAKVEKRWQEKSQEQET